MHAKEDAAYVGRCFSYCAPGFRATRYSTYSGAEGQGGGLLMTHEKPRTCGQNVVVMLSDNGPIRCPCCCYLPHMISKDALGNVTGKTEYLCDACLFVPKFR